MEDNTPVRMKITGMVRKFRPKPDGTEWTNEELDSGLADDFLIEEVPIEDEFYM